LTVAVNAIRAASAINTFISVTEEGKVAAFRTSGNPHCHVILRGGTEPNYEKPFVDACEAALEKAAIRPNIMIDCSHGNSRKQHDRQLDVLDNVAEQIEAGNQSIIGVMVESHIKAGNQPIPDDLDEIQYGVSVTDACIDWPTTETALRKLAERVGPALRKRHSAAKKG
jgi:3-deoxy-7-phosphoheptulonate synthase